MQRGEDVVEDILVERGSLHAPDISMPRPWHAAEKWEKCDGSPKPWERAWKPTGKPTTMALQGRTKPLPRPRQALPRRGEGLPRSFQAFGLRSPSKALGDLRRYWKAMEGIGRSRTAKASFGS